MAIDTRWLRARVDLLGLLSQDTHLGQKVASTRGGEYAGPCPSATVPIASGCSRSGGSGGAGAG